MSTKFLPSRFAALAAAGALLTGVTVSGCQTRTIHHPPGAPDSTKEVRTIHHPPGVAEDGKDGPVRHRSRHHRHMRSAEPPTTQSTAPAPITHPGG